MKPAGDLAEVDYLAVRDGAVTAVVEIKSRLNREPSDYGATLFVNVHKLESLKAAAEFHGAKAAIFAWHFPGEIRWIDVSRLEGRTPERRGREDRDGLDIRPAVRVALSETGRVLLDKPAPPPVKHDEEEETTPWYDR
jgi:hypothetical protein